jgi:pimeloyl-ACP methyl ester carboxylesterase
MTDFVFLHGGGQGGWVWDELIAAMHQQAMTPIRTLALDAPGCGGKRGRDTSATTFADITAELVDDIVAAGLRDVILVGHSQAGTSIPSMVALRPDLFRQLVFVSCIAPDNGLTVVEMTGQKIHAGGGVFSDASLTMTQRYHRMFCNDMTPAQAEEFVAKLGADGWPPCCYVEKSWEYSHLADVPVSYVLCEQDAILPLVWQEAFAARMFARSTPRIDAGHQAMNTRPQALAEILLAGVAI